MALDRGEVGSVRHVSDAEHGPGRAGAERGEAAAERERPLVRVDLAPARVDLRLRGQREGGDAGFDRAAFVVHDDDLPAVGGAGRQALRHDRERAGRREVGRRDARERGGGVADPELDRVGRGAAGGGATRDRDVTRGDVRHSDAGERRQFVRCGGDRIGPAGRAVRNRDEARHAVRVGPARDRGGGKGRGGVRRRDSAEVDRRPAHRGQLRGRGEVVESAGAEVLRAVNEIYVRGLVARTNLGRHREGAAGDGRRGDPDRAAGGPRDAQQRAVARIEERRPRALRHHRLRATVVEAEAHRVPRVHAVAVRAVGLVVPQVVAEARIDREPARLRRHIVAEEAVVRVVRREEQQRITDLEVDRVVETAREDIGLALFEPDVAAVGPHVAGRALVPAEDRAVPRVGELGALHVVDDYARDAVLVVAVVPVGVREVRDGADGGLHESGQRILVEFLIRNWNRHGKDRAAAGATRVLDFDRDVVGRAGHEAGDGRGEGAGGRHRSEFDRAGERIGREAVAQRGGRAGAEGERADRVDDVDAGFVRGGWRRGDELHVGRRGRAGHPADVDAAVAARAAVGIGVAAEIPAAATATTGAVDAIFVAEDGHFVVAAALAGTIAAAASAAGRLTDRLPIVRSAAAATAAGIPDSLAGDVECDAVAATARDAADMVAVAALGASAATAASD